MNYPSNPVRAIFAIPFLFVAAILCLAGKLLWIVFRFLSQAFCAVGCHVYGIPMPEDQEAVEPQKD